MERTLAIETIKKVGKTVLLKGWVNTRRDHGKIVFIDLRDRTGVVQVVCGTEAKELRPEYVVAITGTVKKRPENLVNPNLETGEIEVSVEKIDIISRAKELPLPIDTDGREIDEEVRLKYRYLDLRRPRMAKTIRLRSRAITFIRNYLINRDFVEIETPILTKTTPEGARDFLVPSRLQKGKFYALPQSPQQYKQLLMVAGFERYFQIARCFRDEDPRADRAYGEFTQLDVEMSFVEQSDILQLAEELFTKLVSEVFPGKHVTQSPWPKISHREAIEKHGSDKPDLRKDKLDKDELAFAWIVDFPLFKEQSVEDFFYGSGKAKFAPSHHMFTAPHPEDIPLLETNPLKVRGLQHDLVLNGYEIGGGSIRIHQPEIQERIFELIGFSQAQKREFAHMLEAFTYGVPPHGGIAPGIDRFLMAALGEPSLREAIAFPATSSGQITVMEAPSEASPEQLKELGIAVVVGAAGKSANVFEKIKGLLDKPKIKYEAYEHEPVFTSEQAAKVRGTKLEQGAKALVMFADGKPIMLVVPGNCKVDTQQFKFKFKIRDLRMATPEEVKSLTGTEIGAVPPFGSVFGLPLYVDEELGQNERIVFNAGEHSRSIEMKYEDYEKVARPTIGRFSLKIG